MTGAGEAGGRVWAIKDGSQVGLTDKVVQTKDLPREAGSGEDMGQECPGRRTQPWPLEGRGGEAACI